MLNISFFELLVILVAALLLIGPKELPGLLVSVKKGIFQLRSTVQSLKNSIGSMDEIATLKQEMQEMEQSVTEIIDLDGNVQKTYDISSIMPSHPTTKIEQNNKHQGESHDR